MELSSLVNDGRLRAEVEHILRYCTSVRDFGISKPSLSMYPFLTLEIESQNLYCAIPIGENEKGIEVDPIWTFVKPLPPAQII